MTVYFYNNQFKFEYLKWSMDYDSVSAMENHRLFIYDSQLLN